MKYWFATLTPSLPATFYAMEINVKFKMTIPDEIKKERRIAISINLRRVGQMVTHPRQVFAELENENHKADWKSPIIVIGLILILASLMSVTSSSGTSATQAQTYGSNTSTGFSNMSPGGMQGGGPMGMGGQTQSTATTDQSSATDETATSTTASSSTLLSKILSAAGALLSFVLTWLLVGSLANLISISLGGQGNTKLATVFSAWACVPIGIRSLMQIMYVLATGNSIQAVGLSGFAPTSSTTLATLLEKILAQIDIYSIWQTVLLVIGMGVMTKLDKKKSIVIAVTSIVIVVLLKSLLGLGVEKIASINVSSGLLNTMMR